MVPVRAERREGGSATRPHRGDKHAVRVPCCPRAAVPRAMSGRWAQGLATCAVRHTARRRVWRMQLRRGWEGGGGRREPGPSERSSAGGDAVPRCDPRLGQCAMSTRGERARRERRGSATHPNRQQPSSEAATVRRDGRPVVVSFGSTMNETHGLGESETATRWVKPPWVLRLGRLGPPRAPRQSRQEHHAAMPPCRHATSLPL